MKIFYLKLSFLANLIPLAVICSRALERLPGGMSIPLVRSTRKNTSNPKFLASIAVAKQQ